MATLHSTVAEALVEALAILDECSELRRCTDADIENLSALVLIALKGVKALYKAETTKVSDQWYADFAHRLGIETDVT